LAELNDAWQSFWGLLDAPVDDEPYTCGERAEVDAALEQVRQGQGIPLDELFPRSEPGR
jgi:hypothetical protein